MTAAADLPTRATTHDRSTPPAGACPGPTPCIDHVRARPPLRLRRAVLARRRSGPASVLLVRHLAVRFDSEPDGFELDLAHTARLLGLGTGLGRWGPIQRTIHRCVSFGFARRWGDAAAGPSATLPPVTRQQLARLPEDRQAAARRAGGPGRCPQPRRSGRLGAGRLLEPLDQLDQQAHAEAGAALGDLGVVAVGERRAGDVEVRPGDALGHELAEEQPRDQRAAAEPPPMFFMSATVDSTCLRYSGGSGSRQTCSPDARRGRLDLGQPARRCGP